MDEKKVPSIISYLLLTNGEEIGTDDFIIITKAPHLFCF